MKITANGAQAARGKFRSFIGAKLWAAFQVDIVADGILMTGSPEQVSPLTEVRIIDRPRATWKVYPMVDHVADNVCAVLERHGGNPRPDSRTSSQSQSPLNRRSRTPEAGPGHGSWTDETLELPAAFDVPDRAMWERGYRAEARRTVGCDAVDLETARPLCGRSSTRCSREPATGS